MTGINQANQYFQQGNLKQAELLYRQLLQKNTKDINALWGLAKVALALDNYQVAYDILTKCIQLFSQEPRLWLSLAEVCQKLTRFDEAELALKNAYQLNNDYLPSLLALAIYYCESGEFDRAESYLLATLAIKADHVQAFCLLVRIKKVFLLEQISQLMLNRLNTSNSLLPLEDKVALHYAFFTLCHQQKDHKQAFEHLKQANDYQFSMVDFTVDDMQPFFKGLIKTFDNEALLNQQPLTHDSSLIPIFIVGQPRSGSTLLEQMLIGHLKISSGGELPFLAGDIAQGIWQLTNKHFPEGCSDLSLEQCQILGQHYLKKMQSLAPNANYIIDKMPANYQSIGLIKMLMPQAKVIHISRDSADVSWSIYQNNFEVAEPYFCSFTDIIKYHHCYQEVMTHWQQIIPDFIHNIEYDKLVSDPKKELTKVLDFCGLKFEHACLTFADEKRYISTLSDIQLRAGISKPQTGAYLPYQEYLPDQWKSLLLV